MISDYDAKKIAKMVVQLWKEEISPDTDEFMSIADAAKYLHIAVSTLYKMGDRVPRTKVGGRLVYSKASLNRYLYGRRK